MPGPPPPPPPGGPPPMMPPPLFSSGGKGGPDERSALLSSIRKGTTLKKTVTVDKSAPLIPGKASTNANVSSRPTGANTAPSPSPMTNGMGLGGLFANGMPKLRPTGRSIGGANNNGQTAPSVNNTRTEAQPPPQKNFSSIQSELKKQMASDSRNRGPPPPAPVRNMPDDSRQPYSNKNGSSNGLHHNSSSPNINMAGLHLNSSVLHRKASSNVNLTNSDMPDSSHNNNLPAKPVINHGKPNLAPKPPSLNGKPAAPPKKLVINGKAVGRAQSMKSPRSPSPQSPDNNNPKFGTVRNLSTMLNHNLNHSTGNLAPKPRPLLNGRPNAPPPSIPGSTPPLSANHSPSPSISSLHQNSPLPPSKINMVKPPNHAPPPPPTSTLPQPPNQAPPPPPHRTNHSVPSRAPPAIPTNAPPPPPRHSSIRDGAGNRKMSNVDLEARFADQFHSVMEFPKPPPFRKLPKVYSSKQAGSKQQAPLPPNHLQLANNRLWDSSTC